MVNYLNLNGDHHGLNPIEFGATGDGITDDTAAIQALLDSISRERGGKLNLPPRKFRLAAPIRIRARSISIDGGANGFSNNPNAEQESKTGSEIFAEGNAIEIGLFDSNDSANEHTRLEGLCFRDMYFWGAGVFSGKKAFYFDNHSGQSQFNNIHIGNFQCGIYSDAVLDCPTFNALDIIHCFQGIYLSEKSLAAYAKFHNCTICDNDGIGILIHPASNSFCCQMVNCVIVRNARTVIQDGCNVYWGARESIIANNIIHAAGYHFYNEAVLGHKDNHVRADGIIVDGSDNLITGNQILDHAMGTAIVVKGANNKIINNSFSGRVGSSHGGGNAIAPICRNQLDIHVKPGACDTTITQQGSFTLIDEGIRTTVNGISKNEGDPDCDGNWKGISKPYGLMIYDTLNDSTYFYAQSFPNGRIEISTNPNSHSSPAHLGARHVAGSA